MDCVSGKARGVFGGWGWGDFTVRGGIVSRLITIKFGDRLLVINKDDFTEHLRVEDDN